VSGDSRAVHRFDVLEAQTVHGLAKRGPDPPSQYASKASSCCLERSSRRASRSRVYSMSR